MPDNCTNVLFVSGTKSEVDVFLKENECLDFNKYIPIPADIEDGIDWCVKNWGTKWNAYKQNWHLETHPDCRYWKHSNDGDFVRVCCIYYTAYSPAIEPIKELMKTYAHLDVSLEWYSAAFNSCGVLKYEMDFEEKSKVFWERDSEYYGRMGF